MLKKFIAYLKQPLAWALIFFFAAFCLPAHALPFRIVPNGALPTNVVVGHSVTAAYTVTNNTAEVRDDNYVKYLPPNVTVDPAGCGQTFDLNANGQAGDSCVLNLVITRAVNGADPNPMHHLFVCFPGGVACAGTNTPLNLTETGELTSIVISPSSATIAQGNSLQYTATGFYSDGTTQNLTNAVTWSSTNPNIATVSATGLAQSFTQGTVMIGANFGAINANPASLTVGAVAINSIAVTPTTASIQVGLTEQYTATATYSDGSTGDVTDTATWASSNTAIATVNTTGLATGQAIGTAGITASESGVTSNAAMLTVVAPTLLSITVTGPSGTTTGSVAAGQTLQLTATGTYSNGTTANISSSVSWASDTPSVATVDGNGVATGHIIGTANLTASSGGINSTPPPFTLTVTAAVLVAISVTPTNGAVVPTGTLQYSAIGEYSDGSNPDLTTVATWTVLDPTIATITNPGGLATGVAIGSTTVTATYQGVSSNAASLTVAPHFAYISNINSNTVVYCPINSDTSFGACVDSGVAFTAPSGLTPNSAKTLLYVVNSVSGGGSIFICTPQTAGGFATTCQDSGATNLNQPRSLALNPSGSIAYVANLGLGNVVYCNVNSANGTLSNCQPTDTTGITSPIAISIHPTNGYAYIADSSQSKVFACVIQSTNALVGCADSLGTGFASPMAVSFSPNGRFAYISNGMGNTISICNVSGSAQLVGCTPASATFSVPVGQSITNSLEVAFIANSGSNTVSSCVLNGNSTLGACTPISDPSFNVPYGIYLQ